MKSKNQINHNYFKIMTNEAFWFLGLLASDGCVTDSSDIAITQSGDKGKKLITYLSNMLECKNKITEYQPKKGERIYGIKWRSKEMANDLLKYNITPRKSLTYELPKFEKKEHLKNFLRGYIDGDGCVRVISDIRKVSPRKCKQLKIQFLGSQKFIEQISIILPILNQKDKSKNAHGIGTSGRQAVIFGNWIYSDNSLYKSYKYNTYIEYINLIHGEPRWSINNKIVFDNKDEIFNKNINPSTICDKLKLSKKTIYNWRNSNKSTNLYYIQNLVLNIRIEDYINFPL